MANIQRDSTQDILKGIGIILVVAGHALRGGLSGKYGPIANIWFFIDFLIYAVHMPLFFYLSGLNAFRSMNKDKSYVASRFSTLLKPYIAFTLIYFLLNMTMQKLVNVNQPIGITDLMNIWYKPISIMWFLYALFFIQIIVFLIRKNQYLITSVLVLSAITGLFSNSELLAFPLELFAHMPFFILGYLVSKYGLNPNVYLGAYRHLKLLLITSVYLVGCYIAFYGFGLKPVSTFTIGLSVVGIFLLYKLAEFVKNFKAADLLIYLGQLSFPIYLLHLIPLAAVPRILSKLGEYNQFNNIVLGTIFSIVISILIYKLLTKAKLSVAVGLSK